MKSLNKALDILELFLSGEKEMALADIANKTGLNKTTVSHIVKALVKRGYMKQKEKRGKYSLGTTFIEFSGVIKGNIKIRDVALPHLVELSRIVKESVILAIWDGKSAILTETVHPIRVEYTPLKVVPDEGSKSPLHCTSIGKLILADMTEQKLKEFYRNRNNYHRFTPNTITTFNEMKRHLVAIKQEGIAFDDEEYAPGVRGVSAGLRDNEGNTIGAIGVLGPSVRFTHEKMRGLSGAIKNCALEISRELGYKG
jgi:IclR family transcriptional regulator, KDG regulon repressor